MSSQVKLKVKRIEQKIVKLIPHDKALHMVFGNIIFIAFFILFFFTIQNVFISTYLAFSVTFLISFFKEIFDKTVKKTRISTLDILFTICGCIPALLLIILIL